MGLRRARPGRGQRLRLLVAFSCGLRRDELDGRELVGSGQWAEDDDVLVLSETVLVLVIESRMLWQGDEFDYEHRDAEHEHEHDEILERLW